MPRHDVGPDPVLREQAQRRDARREDGGLCRGRQLQGIRRPLEARAAERKIERGVGLLERPAADRRGVMEVLPHADALAPLSREKKCQHRFHAPRETACSDRWALMTSWILSFTRLSIISAAALTAFLIALAEERPWQMMALPLTPSSGMPPYSA